MFAQFGAGNTEVDHQMRIVVTGAFGFIGRHAAAELIAAGHEVVAFGRRKPSNPAIEGHVCDLLETGSAEALLAALRPDALLHLAWTTEHGKFWTDPTNDLWARRSIALARAAVSAGTGRIVMAGTCFEYGFDGGGDCDERTTPLAGETPYGRAKIACRTGVAELARAAGVSFAWGRLFHLYGPHEAPGRLVSSISRALVAGEPAPMSSGSVWRDFMDSRDAGAGIAALTLSGVEGDVNVASGNAVQIITLAKMLAELAGRPALLRVGALGDRDNEPVRIVARVERLHEEVGFQPIRSLREGLADALAWWRAQAH